MIRSPGGRAHFRTKAEFDLEMLRIETELKQQGAGHSRRLNLDAIMARCGFLTDEHGDLWDVETGASSLRS